MSETQAVIFTLENEWIPKKAKEWLKKHSLKPIKAVHRTSQSLRYRLKEPSMFSRFVTKHLGNGVSLVIGFK